MLFRILVFITFIMAGYSSDTKRSKVAATAFEKSPKWAREAIWYQIFVERFRNGNPNINPTLKTCENGLIDALPPDWEISPWGQNWYEQEAWAKKNRSRLLSHYPNEKVWGRFSWSGRKNTVSEGFGYQRYLFQPTQRYAIVA